MADRFPVRIATLALAATLAGCAGTGGTIPDSDPWEGYNRGMNGFNNVADRILLKPLAQGYRFIMPDIAERGVSNMFSNLGTPVDAVNNLLQGKPVSALSDVGRLVVNTTFGLGGLFDPASEMGLVNHNEDFGQTLAVWGVPAGPYVVLPFMGPTTVRDGFGMIPDQLLDGRNLIDDSGIEDKLIVTQIISGRASLLALDDQVAASNDPYIFVREAILQRRNFLIYDGNPPEDEEEFEIEDDFDADL